MASVKDSEEEKFLKLESLAEKTSRAINIIASNLDVAGTEVKVCLSDGLGANCNKGGEILSLTFIGKDAKAATTKARQILNATDSSFTRAYIKPLKADLLFGQKEIEFDLDKLSKLKAGDFDKAMLDVISAKAVSEFNINQSTTSGRSI